MPNTLEALFAKPVKPPLPQLERFLSMTPEQMAEELPYLGEMEQRMLDAEIQKAVGPAPEEANPLGVDLEAAYRATPQMADLSETNHGSRQLVTLGRGARNHIASLAFRATDAVGITDGMADAANRDAEAVSRANAEINDEAFTNGWKASAGASGAQSVLEMIPGAIVGGGALRTGHKVAAAVLPALFGGVNQANIATTSGSDKGLEGVELAGYAIGQGAAEALFELATMKVGKGVAPMLNKLFAQQPAREAVKRGFAEAAKELALNYGVEYTTEMMTGATQAYLDQLYGMDPNALTPDSLWQMAKETAIAVAVMSGSSGSIDLARGAQESLQDRFAVPGVQPATTANPNAASATPASVAAPFIDPSTGMPDDPEVIDGLGGNAVPPAAVQSNGEQQGATPRETPRETPRSEGRREEDTHDSMTGVFNSKTIRERMAKHEDDPNSAILYLDIDDFKAVNDIHGHDVGDEVLGAFGAMLKKHFGAEGSPHAPGRAGGEEFVVVVDTRDPELQNRLKAFLDDAQGITVDGDPITVSGGLRRGGEERTVKDKQVYHAFADDLLLQAKAEGKNRIALDQEGGVGYIEGKKAGRKRYVEQLDRQEVARRAKRILGESEVLPPELRDALSRTVQALEAGTERGGGEGGSGPAEAAADTSQDVSAGPGTGVSATKEAQAVASHHGIDLKDVTPTGRGGKQITQLDVIRHKNEIDGTAEKDRQREIRQARARVSKPEHEMSLEESRERSMLHGRLLTDLTDEDLSLDYAHHAPAGASPDEIRKALRANIDDRVAFQQEVYQTQIADKQPGERPTTAGHYRRVKQALKEGHRVHASVVEHYPDLRDEFSGQIDGLEEEAPASAPAPEPSLDDESYRVQRETADKVLANPNDQSHSMRELRVTLSYLDRQFRHYARKNQEAKEAGAPLPSRDLLDSIQREMDNVQRIIQERESARNSDAERSANAKKAIKAGMSLGRINGEDFAQEARAEIRRRIYEHLMVKDHRYMTGMTAALEAAVDAAKSMSEVTSAIQRLIPDAKLNIYESAYNRWVYNKYNGQMSVGSDSVSDTPSAPVTTTTPPWMMSRRDYQLSKAKGNPPILNSADGRDHEKAVRAALEAGEHVPHAVMEDYPDLAKGEDVKLPQAVFRDQLRAAVAKSQKYKPGTSGHEEATERMGELNEQNEGWFDEIMLEYKPETPKAPQAKPFDPNARRIGLFYDPDATGITIDPLLGQGVVGAGATKAAIDEAARGTHRQEATDGKWRLHKLDVDVDGGSGQAKVEARELVDPLARRATNLRLLLECLT
jgi:diguanylate cyclase (GGDEF)-like protein